MCFREIKSKFKANLGQVDNRKSCHVSINRARARKLELGDVYTLAVSSILTFLVH